MKKIVIATLILLSGFATTAQNDVDVLNNYQYVVVPLSYDFLDNEKNKFLLNSWTKHLLNQHQFETYIETDPKVNGLKMDRCLGLYADVEGTPMQMFSLSTTLQLVLKDCEGNVVYKSDEGRSKKKDYEEAYKEALKDAMAGFGSYVHRYNGKNGFYEKSSASSSLDEETDETPLGKARHFTYRSGSTLYSLKAIDAGYIVLEKETEKRIAHLHTTSSGTILYSSDEVNGTVNILDNGNLQVEYFDKETEQVKYLTFQRKSID